MTVYLVMDHDGSCSWVERVFLTREKAEAFASVISASVEEKETADDEPMPERYEYWSGTGYVCIKGDAKEYRAARMYRHLNHTADRPKYIPEFACRYEKCRTFTMQDGWVPWLQIDGVGPDEESLRAAMAETGRRLIEDGPST